MVVKTETCSFSGLKIYPGHGILFVRADQKSFKFINRKVKSMSTQRLNPRKIAWTQVYRRMHKKGTLEESQRKKARKVNKATTKAVVGASLEVIKAKRNQKPEVRAAAREAALREVKERAKAKQAAKKVDKPKPAPAKAPAPKGGKSSKATNKQGAKGVRR
jgi:large subunit ribosomal protein L24e